jgi:ankyrin repeat protein
MKKIIVVLFSIFYIVLGAQTAECKKLKDAVIQENNKEFNQLLSKNTNVDCVSKNDKSALGIACAYGNKEFVKLLLQKRADPNIVQFYNGKSIGTPLFDALSICSQTLEPKLLDPVKISSVKQQVKKESCTPKIKDEITLMLIENGANVLLVDDDHITTLMMASMYRRSDKVLTLLIDKGVDINARNSYGKTALMYAVINNDCRSVKRLTSFGADTSIKDNEGKTALDIAKENNFKKISTFLSAK